MGKEVEKLISAGKFVSSYIFFGSDQIKLLESAKKFAKSLSISDFDIVEVVPDIGEKNAKNEIKIKAIREMIRQISLTPGHGEKKLAIIHDADKLNTEAANSLLKTLEEPPATAIIILFSANLELIPTIISRCQIVRFSENNIAESGEFSNQFTEIENSNLSQSFKLADKISAKSELPEILESWLSILRSKLRDGNDPKTIEKIEAVFEAKKNIKITTSKKLVLENLFLKIKN